MGRKLPWLLVGAALALAACSTSVKGPLGGTIHLGYEPPGWVETISTPVEPPAVQPPAPAQPAPAPAPKPQDPAPKPAEPANPTKVVGASS